jgi:hypothetical protein
LTEIRSPSNIWFLLLLTDSQCSTGKCWLGDSKIRGEDDASLDWWMLESEDEIIDKKALVLLKECIY